MAFYPNLFKIQSERRKRANSFLLTRVKNFFNTLISTQKSSYSVLEVELRITKDRKIMKPAVLSVI